MLINSAADQTCIKSSKIGTASTALQVAVGHAFTGTGHPIPRQCPPENVSISVPPTYHPPQVLLIQVGASGLGNQLLRAYGPLSQNLQPHEGHKQNLEVHRGERGFYET